MLLPRSNLREEELRKSANIDQKYKIRAKIGQHLVRYCMHEDAKRASFWAYERVSPSRAKNSISRSLSPAANPFEESHWPLFYRGCLGCVGVLKDWLIRTVSAALRKGDTRLTLDRVREQELVEASLADMAADIVAGEQQVALTSGDRSQLNSLLQMEGEVAAPAETSAGEAKPTSTKRTSTKPGTRKPKRDPVGDQTPGSSTQT
jgi:hypothetical protein